MTSLARIALPALFLLATFGAALAEDGPEVDPCDADRMLFMPEIRESVLVGLWSAELGPGYVVTGGTVIAHPSDPNMHFGRIEQDGDGLVLIPSEGGVVLDLEWAGEETWRFDREPSLPEGIDATPGTLPILPYSSDSLAEQLGCPISDLPRIVGTGAAVIDGVTMNFTYRLMAVSHWQLLGFQEVTGTPPETVGSAGMGAGRRDRAAV